MTQEFEKWCSFENLGVSPDLNASHVKVAKAAWQASREQLKAKLLSDEMVNKVANVFGGYLGKDAAKAALEAIVREI
jgi:peroxiredoxin